MFIIEFPKRNKSPRNLELVCPRRLNIAKKKKTTRR